VHGRCPSESDFWILFFGLRNPFGGLRNYSMGSRSKGKPQNNESRPFSFFFNKICSKITKNAENGK
jgi:hypothetical protein